MLDLQLPGLSGLDLQKQMAEAGLETPIVFLTGHGSIPASVQAMKAGAIEFLTKPVDEQDLLRQFRRPSNAIGVPGSSTRTCVTCETGTSR